MITGTKEGKEIVYADKYSLDGILKEIEMELSIEEERHTDRMDKIDQKTISMLFNKRLETNKEDPCKFHKAEKKNKKK